MFLRLLVDICGVKLLKFQQIAELFDYPDRRNVNNYWREFEQHGHDLLAYLSRKVDLKECVPLIENFVAKNLLLPMSIMYREFLGKHTIKMSYPTFLKYARQINPLVVIAEAQKLLSEKVSGGNAIHILRLLADQHNVPVICDDLLKHAQSAKPKAKQKVKSALFPNLERKNLCLLVHYLVGSGMNFKTIALLLNTCKATVSNLWHEIADLQSMILDSISRWSGKISIDEKFVRINGIPHYVISIVDFVTGLPLYLDLYQDTKKESFEACFRAFKLIYKKDPTLIVSDGSKSLAAARKTVFPHVHYQLCKFHKIRNLFKKISQCHLTYERQLFLKVRVIKAFRRDSVSGRKKGLRDLLPLVPAPAAEYIQTNIIKQWRQLSKGLTSNASERFNRKIKKVMSGRYGLKSQDTTRNLVYSLWFKELVDKGRPFLHDESLIATLNISRICQENVDWAHLDHLFSKCSSKAA